MNNLPPLRTVKSASAAGLSRSAPESQDLSATPAPTCRVLDSVAIAMPAALPAVAKAFLQELIDLRLLEPSAVQTFLAQAAGKLPGLSTRERVGQALTHAKLLTPYQRDRVVAGSTFGLVLGPYRVLDRLGGGSVGVVFLGEHVLLRRQVAIKVLAVDDSVSADLLARFHAEMRILAGINHPHVVAAHDAGQIPSEGPGEPSLHYLVLELVSGGDLEQYVYDNGPLPTAQACEWVRQAASGLQAAHDRSLVHRDLKPSNLLLTADRRVKVVDFGLARELASVRTMIGSLLGSVEFMSPEQAADPTSVGPAADVYGLGVTLFWILTGQLPFARSGSLSETLKAIQHEPFRRVRDFRPDVSPELDRFIARMLARNSAERPTALEVKRGLAPFAGTGSSEQIEQSGQQSNTTRLEVVRLRDTVKDLEGSLRARDGAFRKAQDAVLVAMAAMAESHDGETAAHSRRMQEYVRVLAEGLVAHVDWPVVQDSTYRADLLRCVPLHDIGKTRLPDAVLTKPGALTATERSLVETHTLIGCDILERLARQQGDTLPFLSMARAIVRSHHERWDGSGYPDHLVAEEIPPAARLVAMADVYDSLRRDRADRPGLDHATAALAILGSSGQFDPVVVEAFRSCEKAFEEIYLTVPDGGGTPGGDR